jgi:hypothetical protein
MSRTNKSRQPGGRLLFSSKENVRSSVRIVCIFVALRFKALILSLCTLLYLAEIAAVPRTMELCMSGAAAGSSSATTACTSGAATASPAGGSCCHRAMPAGKKGQCPKKEQCPKPSKGCNSGADCCLNCPLCYVMLLPVSAERAGMVTGAREYGVWHAAYLYHYHASCWKPPNQA